MSYRESTKKLLWRFFSRPIHWLIGGLAICVITAGLTNSFSGPPSLLDTILLSSALALFAVMGVWLGTGKPWWRVLVILFCMPLVAANLISNSGPGQYDEFFLLCFLGALVVAVVASPILLFRWLRNGKLKKLSPDETSANEVIQFGVFHLLVLTTCVAGVISLGQWMIPIVSQHLSQLADQQAFLIVTKIGLTLSFGSLVAVWATLGNRTIFRSALSAFAIVVIAFLNYFFIRFGPFQWVYSAITLVVWAQVTATVWCLRAEGYRFIMLPRDK